MEIGIDVSPPSSKILYFAFQPLDSNRWWFETLGGRSLCSQEGENRQHSKRTITIFALLWFSTPSTGFNFGWRERVRGEAEFKWSRIVVGVADVVWRGTVDDTSYQQSSFFRFLFPKFRSSPSFRNFYALQFFLFFLLPSISRRISKRKFLPREFPCTKTAQRRATY